MFDLDGTLTRRDSFVPFVLGLLARHPLRWLRVPLLAFPGIGYLLRFVDRGQLKGAIVHLLFSGFPRQDIAAWAATHARRTIEAGLFSEGRKAFESHLAAGDEVILLSASPDLYVPLIGQALGAHRTICTELRWTADRLDGRLATPNRRGPEKARIVAQLRAERPGTACIAYGNSPADLDHMLPCDEAVYVNGSAALRQRIPQPHVRWVHWR